MICELVFDFSRDAPIAGVLLLTSTRRPSRQSIVCEVAPKGKADSSEKRRRQGRLRNKSRKSEARTRMKKMIYVIMASIKDACGKYPTK
ncbi:hypothetical protein Droror1_Dr00007429 [Drosera rotundifolia]